MNTLLKRMLILSFILGGLFIVPGCASGGAEEVGENIDDVADDVKDAADDAADEVEDAADDVEDAFD